MTESAFLQQCAKGRRAWRRASVFAVVPTIMQNGSAEAKDVGVIYAWRLYMLSTWVLVFLLATSWISASMNVLPANHIGWRTYTSTAILILCVAAMTYSVRWNIVQDTAILTYKVLGVTIKSERVSNLRLWRYTAVVRYPRPLARYGASLLLDREAVLIVLDSSKRWIVLTMTESASSESCNDWGGHRYSSVLGLSLYDGGEIVVTNAW